MASRVCFTAGSSFAVLEASSSFFCKEKQSQEKLQRVYPLQGNGAGEILRTPSNY